MIPIFNAILISDKDENAINNGKYVVLFLYRKTLINFMVTLFIVRKLKWAKWVSASLVLAAIADFWFSGFSRFNIYELVTTAIAFLIAFLIKINNKKLDQIISKLQSYFVFIFSRAVLFCFATFLNIPWGYLHYNW